METSKPHVLVVGAEKMLGQAIARRFAQDGARVSSVTSEESFHEEALNEAFTRTTQTMGPVDALVNATGNEFARPFLQTSASDWDAVFASNARSVFLSCRLAIPYLRQGKACIVNLASAAGSVALPLHAAYGAAKAAVVQMSKTLALELRPSGIRVNCVCPGFLTTDLGLQKLGTLAQKGLPVEALVRYRQGRLGSADEVAGVVAFLTSERAGFVNGQAIFVDGGANGC